MKSSSNPSRLLSLDPNQAVPVTDRERQRLIRHVEQAQRRVRRGRRSVVLASITVDVAPEIDPSAVVACGRQIGEPWTVYEQRDRDGQVLATLSVVEALEATGEGRFAAVSRRWSALAADAIGDIGTGLEGEGLVATGGFAFADDGAASPAWDGFAAASLHVPLLSLAGRGGRTRATIAVRVTGDEDPERAVASALDRVAELRPARPPLLDPDPVRRGRVASALPPAHYEAAVARSVERIRAGQMEKIVLAREVQVTGRPTPDPAAVLGVMREAYTGCCVLAVGRGSRTFLAATPELLVRREGNRVATLALAGTTGRSSDPAVESHLAEHLLRSRKDREEHAIVVRRILARLDGIALWTTAPQTPEVVQAASVQHDALPIWNDGALGEEVFRFVAVWILRTFLPLLESNKSRMR